MKKLIKWIIRMGGSRDDFAAGMCETARKADAAGQRVGKWVRRMLRK